MAAQSIQHYSGRVKIAQYCIYPFLLILRFLFVRRRSIATFYAKNRELKKDVSYVVYANHQSRFDALLIAVAFPFSTLRQLLPYHFFTANAYFKGIFGVVLSIFGCFRAFPADKKPYGLSHATELIATGATLVIFPTGKRTRQQTGTARRGIAVLASSPQVELLPVHIDWKNRWSCTIAIGAPFRPAGDETPDELMQRVYELLERA